MCGFSWLVICILLLSLIIYSSFVSLQGWIIGLSNTYGLCFVVFLLGPGLVELPVK